MRKFNQAGTDGAEGGGSGNGGQGGGQGNGGQGGGAVQRPEYVPEQFWDKDKGTANVETLAREYAKTNTELTTLKGKQAAVPEKYELKLGEKSLLNPEALERTATTARALGLSQENAQKALDYVQSEVQAYHEGLMTQHTAKSETWLTESKADKELAGEKGDQFDANSQLAHRAFKHFFGEDIAKLMNATGFGNHPGVLKGFLKIAKAMADDKFDKGGQGGGDTPPDAAQVLYGGTPNKT